VIVAVIVTVKVLGLRGGGDAVGAAVWRVVDYLRGGTPEAAVGAGLVGYYRSGSARGAAAARVGVLPGRPVSAEALARLLAGRHAVSGARLVPGSGSAGRTRGAHATGSVEGLGEGVSLAEAARVAGVSARYLRRLAARTAAAGAAPNDSASAGAAAGGSPGAGEGSDRLVAVRDGRGRWRVAREELARFIAEREPPTVVLGFDVTAAAPKSVSMLWAFGDERVRADIAAAMNVAVEAAFAYLEATAAVGLVEGHNRPGEGLAGVSFLHDLSRATEPHLHVHTVIANAVPIPLVNETTGQPVRDAHGLPVEVWRTVDSELLHTHMKTAGFVAAAVLRHELSVRRGWRWTPVRNGVAELAQVPAGLVGAFSSRRERIDAELADLVAGGVRDGAGLRAAVQRATRAPKRVLADAEIRRAQRQGLAAGGYTVADVQAMAAPGDYQPAPLTMEDSAGIIDRLTGEEGLTGRAGTFTRRDVVQQVCALAGDRADAVAIDRLTGRLLADPRIVTVEEVAERRRRDPEPVHTTRDLLAVEERLLARCAAGRTTNSGLVRRLIDPGRLDTALARHVTVAREGVRSARPGAAGGAASGSAAPGSVPAGSGLVGLTVEQVEAVRALLASTDLVRPLVGPAGSGKTEIMRLAAEVLRGAGRLVVGAAHGGRQTEELCERLQIDGRVVAGWLTLLAHADDPRTVWPAGTVLILDEATQVSTRDAARLLDYATRTGTVIVALGDPAQLGPIGPGGWFVHLAATDPGTVALTAVHRQSGPGMAGARAVLDGLRAGASAHVRRALRRLADAGQLRTFASRPALLAAAVEDWHTDRAHHPPTAPDPHAGPGTAAMAHPMTVPVTGPVTRAELADRPRMMAGDHGTVEWLNRAAQLRRITDGELDPYAYVEVAGRRFHVGDEVLTLTQAGHTLIPAGRSPSAYIRTGTLGVVTGLNRDPANPTAQTVTVAFPGKGTVTIGWDYLIHAFPDGRDGGLALAYALTAHKAQGATMPTARPVITDATSRAGLYVMLSRGRAELAAYLTSGPLLRADPAGGGTDDQLPVLPAPAPTVGRLASRISGQHPDRLTTTLDPDLPAVTALRASHSLAQLTALRRAAHPTNRTGAGADETVSARPTAPISDLPVGANSATFGADGATSTPLTLTALTRAERASAAAIEAAALADPPAALLARIGSRPATGPARRAWDDAVTGLAVYQARHAPQLPPGDEGPAPPPGADDALTAHWHEQRSLASALAKGWAAALDPTHRTGGIRGPAAGRATAAIHALLAAGNNPAEISGTLTANDSGPIRDGLAVLDTRLSRLCSSLGIDPDDHAQPPPASAHQDWQTVRRWLDRAETWHLATRPTTHLAADLHTGGDRLAPRGSGPEGPAAETPPQRQARLIATALDLQTDIAVVRAAVDPPSYLTELLGERTAARAADWDRAATGIERWRHHHGLIPTQSAASDDAPAAHRALGPPPSDPDEYSRWQALAQPELAVEHPTPDVLEAGL